MGGCGGEGEPALEHAVDGAASGAGVEFRDDGEPPAGFPGVVGFVGALEDGVVEAAKAVAVLFPAFDAAAVHVWAQGEAGVAGGADAEAVCVGDGVGGGD